MMKIKTHVLVVISPVLRIIGCGFALCISSISNLHDYVAFTV